MRPVFVGSYNTKKQAENVLDMLKKEEGGANRWLMLEKLKYSGWKLVEIVES